jgi:putative colanic acid biosynthesis acetyltransferase WcaF
MKSINAELDARSKAGPGELDIAANRAARKYSGRELAARVCWSAAALVFRWSPRPLYAWRAWLLRRFGARLGRHVHIWPTVRIAHPWLLEMEDFAAVGDGVRLYNLGPIRIGARATISQHAHLCAGTHDYTTAEMTLVKLPITVGADAWICADAFVGPGVTIGEGAVVGARAAVFKNVEPWTIVGGNPAAFIKAREMRSASRKPSGS